MKNCSLFFAFAILIATKGFAQLGIYEFTGAGNCPVQSSSVTTQPLNASFSSMISQNVNCVSVSNEYANDNWNVSSTIDLNEYLEFSITPGSCYSLTLNIISFNNFVSSNGTTAWHLRSSLDNYVADLGSDATSTILAQPAVVLPTGNFTNIGAISFRLYITGINSAATSWIVDQIAIAGYSNPTGMQTFYRDMDFDGFGDALNSVVACNQPIGYITNNSDCNDLSSSINPAATEICDGTDNNCDGLVDNAIVGQTTWYIDFDHDGFGDPAQFVLACFAPAGHVADNTDCNDANYFFNPGAAEICDGFDNDCDGTIDVGAVSVTWFVDADADGWGNPSSSPLVSCTPLPGRSSFPMDCNDAVFSQHPFAVEICDGIDNDCNGISDDNPSAGNVYYLDSDADGFGDVSFSVIACAVPFGYSINASDCDDTNSGVNPSGVEVCDGLDNDCSGVVDDNIIIPVWYLDLDMDGFGDPLSTIQNCVQPVGYTSDNTDCNDVNPAIHVGAVEIANNSIDEDCDGNDLISLLVINSESVNGISISPNPGVNQIDIALSESWGNQIHVNVFSIDGKLIVNCNLINENSSVVVNAQELQSGIYFIQVIDEHHQAQRRWVKL